MRVREHGGMLPVRCRCGGCSRGGRGASTVLGSAVWRARFLSKACFDWESAKMDYVLIGKLTKVLIKAVYCVKQIEGRRLDFLRRGLQTIVLEQVVLHSAVVVKIIPTLDLVPAVSYSQKPVGIIHNGDSDYAGFGYTVPWLSMPPNVVSVVPDLG